MAETNNPSLPRSAVAKLVRDVSTPLGARLSPDAREAVGECGLEFVQLVASVALEHCETKGKRIMTGQHVLAALKTLGYDAYRAHAAAEVELHNAHAASGDNMSKHKRQKMLKLPKLSDAEEAEMALEQQRLFAAAASHAANS